MKTNNQSGENTIPANSLNAARNGNAGKPKLPKRKSNPNYKMNNLKTFGSGKVRFLASIMLLILSLRAQAGGAFDQPTQALGKWVGFSGNFDAGYRNTQFFENNHNVGVAQWDSRLEIWLPPGRDQFSYGPYIRFAGIAATRNPDWENALLAGPGVGGQVYPFSLSCLHREDEPPSFLQWLGPLRLFGEYNRLDYWGTANRWRPDNQVRAGADYWLALNVNNISMPWWAEVWAGAWWQSTNDFDPHYKSWELGESLRGGLRLTDQDFLSWISPYILLESSLSDNQSYFWENRLGVGPGLRIAPPLPKCLPKGLLTRFVVYAEYVYAAGYYGASASPSTPDHDIRVGVSFSVGDWFYHDPCKN